MQAKVIKLDFILVCIVIITRLCKAFRVFLSITLSCDFFWDFYYCIIESAQRGHDGLLYPNKF